METTVRRTTKDTADTRYTVYAGEDIIGAIRKVARPSGGNGEVFLAIPTRVRNGSNGWEIYEGAPTYHTTRKGAVAAIELAAQVTNA